MVRLGLVTACRLAGSPTRTSPLSVKATTLGVRRLPSWLGMTLTSFPSITATTEFVVPRSMPIIFSSAMTGSPVFGQKSEVRNQRSEVSGKLRFISFHPHVFFNAKRHSRETNPPKHFLLQGLMTSAFRPLALGGLHRNSLGFG